MITQSQVVAKIDSLKAYSVAQNATTANLFAPLYSAVTSYFSTGQSAVKAMSDVIKYMYNDIWRRNTVYEINIPLNLPTNYPLGYSDIRQCFYQFSQLMSISNESFYAGFVFTGLAPAVVATSNSYITTWIPEISAAGSGDISNLNSLAEWCKNSEGDSDLISILEDRGTIKSTMTMRQISNDIYKNRHALEVIHERAQGTYIPTYIGG